MVLIFLISKVVSVAGGVKFIYEDPYASQVYLAGSFNNWNPTALPMNRTDGKWEVIIKLPPGRYEYKFVVDGEWVADPDNPMRTKEYGNSVIEIGEDGEILPPKLFAGTPLSGILLFKGKYKAYFYFKKDTVWVSKTPWHIALLNVETDVEKAKIFAQLKFDSHKEAQGILPITLYKGRATLKGKIFSLNGFYNHKELKTDDPMTLIGRVGEFEEKFGKDEQGIYGLWNLRKFDFMVLYSNNINTDRDLIAGHFKTQRGGFLYIQEKDFDENVYKFSAYSRIINFVYQGVFFWHNKDKEKFSNGFKIKAGLEFNNGDFLIDVEKHNYKNLKLSPVYTRFEAGYKYKKRKLKFAFRMIYTHYGIPQNLPWKYLFDYFELGRLKYYEYPLIGYRDNLCFRFNLGFRFSKTEIDDDLNIGKLGVLSEPKTIENILRIKYYKKRWIFGADYRIFYIKDDYWKLNNVFQSPYFEIGYRFSPFAALKICYGVDPLNYKDEYKGRREFLEDYGVTYDNLRAGYKWLGQYIKDGERALSQKIITIKGEVKF